MKQIIGFDLLGIFMPHRMLRKLLKLLEEIKSKNHNSGLVIYAALCKSASLMGTHVPVRLFLSR